jgi:formylglycine-generating enzyme required for sulfatase activity
MNEPFDPYYTWLGIPPPEQPANFYRLLGIQLFEPNPRVIENAADRQMMLLRSFQNGPNSRDSQRLLNEVSAASGCLLDPQTRTAYDHQLGQLTSSQRPLTEPPLAPPQNIGNAVSTQTRQALSVAAATPPAPVGLPSTPLNGQPSSRRSRRDQGIGISHIVQIVVGGVAGLALAIFAIYYFAGTDILGWSVRSRDEQQISGKPRTRPGDSSQPPKPSVNKRPTQDVAPHSTLPPNPLTESRPLIAELLKSKWSVVWLGPEKYRNMQFHESGKWDALEITAVGVETKITGTWKIDDDTGAVKAFHSGQEKFDLIQRAQDKITVIHFLQPKREHNRGVLLAEPSQPSSPSSSSTAVNQVEPVKIGATITNSIGMKFAYIPPGEFLMGSPKEEKGGLDGEFQHFQHRVEITKPFYLGVYEVTQEEYGKLTGRNPSWFSRSGQGKDKVQGLDTSKFPVESVSWEDAVTFCETLSAKEGKTYRLPTEAEWEYACRAGKRMPFHFGSELNGDQANCNGDFPYGTKLKGKNLRQTTAVGSYAPNAFGLYDMHGNVWEWCRDYFDKDYYQNSPSLNPSGPSFGSERTIRGGCWDFIASDCRAARRHNSPQSYPHAGGGFRVVCEPAPELATSQKSEVVPAGKPKGEIPLAPATSEAPSPPAATVKDDPPDNSQREIAQKRIADVFRSEIAEAKTTARKSELAKKLLSVGRETRGDAPTRFILYEQAGEIAASGADVETAMRAADAILEKFTRVDSLELKEPLLQKAVAAAARNKAQHAAIALAALDLVEVAITEDKLEAADRFWKLTLSERRSAGAPIPKNRADVIGDTLEFLQSQAAEYRKQREGLELDPKNADANLFVGRYLLLGKRPREGLLNLQKGSDEALKRLAELEAAEKPTATEVYDLAEGWKRQADSTKNTAERRTMLELALIAYRRSAKELLGLDQVRATKQIEHLTKEGVGDIPLLKSLNLSKAEGEGISSITKEFHKKERAILTNTLGMKFAYIPPGEFLMGSPDEEKGHYADAFQHEVKITKPFYLGVYEVTQEEYWKLIGANPSNFSRSGASYEKVQGQNTARFPVEQVTWEEAVTFCEKLSAKEGKKYRLPSEAEWEYACRAGKTKPFHFGNELNGDQANCRGDQPYGTEVKGKTVGRPTTVGSYAPNAFGLYDMHGNVWEWCRDYYAKDYYQNSPSADPPGPFAGSSRVVRGGGWFSSASECRSATRSRDSLSSVNCIYGFRVLQEVNESLGIAGKTRSASEATTSATPPARQNAPGPEEKTELKKGKR